MVTTWVLVANSNQAKFFRRNRPFKGLDLLKKLHRTEINVNNVLQFKSKSTIKGRDNGAIVELGLPKKQKAERFARELASELEAARAAKHYGRLILVAPPRFLGELDKQLSEPIRNMVVTNILKNYTSMEEKRLVDKVNEHCLL